jgi:hypothetical protein
MPYRTNLGLMLGQSLGGLGASLAGGGRNGISAAYQDFAMEARGKESLADAALKQRQTAPSAEEMALNEVGAVGSMRDMLLKASRGEQVTSEIPQQLLQSFLKGKNAYSSVEPSNFEQIQKGLGVTQENNLVKNIAESGYNSDIGKALLLAKGKAPFAGGTYNATDLTTGSQKVNPLGQSVIGLNQDKGKQALAGAALDYSGIDENEAQIRKINHGMNMDELDFTRKNSEFERELDFKQKGGNKPLSEFQQYQLDEKKGKKEADYMDAVSNIDNTIAEMEDLKKVQARTPTGPVIGSAPGVMIRKMLPDNIGQGKDLQRLEKGYNKAAINAIAAFKAGGVTFGQLSNKEGDWIRSTAETLNADGEVNQEMLDEGLKLLNQRKARLKRQYGATGGSSRTAGATESWDDATILQQYGGTPEDLAKFKALKGKR